MADSNNLAVLSLGSQRVGGAVFAKSSKGDLILKKYEFSEMVGDPSVDATRLPLLRGAVSEVAAGLRLKGLETWYSATGHVVFARFVQLPPVSDDKVEQIISLEARQNVPWPLNEVAWDYEFVGEQSAAEREAVLVAMKSDALNEINDIVTSTGIKTDGVDLAPMAIFNAFRYSYPEVAEPVVIVDLGARSTNLVFVEDGKMFTRNLLVGGATVTGAVAKEFGLGFGDAEQQKCAHGFVALGGTVEDHSDPALAALSKVIRNSMTRLHGEVLRTINFYRSQQGGSTPQRIFVCGGGARMGYVAEFFQEKFKVPVEIFNPLRGVQLDRSVNAEAAAQDSLAMAELVGLALRGAGSTPMEVELVPDAVAQARDAAKRAPLLIMAGLCLWAMLGVAIIYFSKADEAVKRSLAGMQKKGDELTKYATDLNGLDKQLEDLKAQAGQLQEAVNDRSYWVRLLNELNQKYQNDLIWITQIEPLKNGTSITPALFGAGQTASSSSQNTASSLFAAPAVAGTTAVVDPNAPPAGPEGDKVEMRLLGLYRKNDEGQEVVYRFAKSLATSEFFSAANIGEKLNDYVKAEAVAVGEDRYAYKFEIRLPVKQPLQFKK
ncbi:MAG: Type pilus assembly protein PilM [Verrucomicrobiaceae bacterium]|nr:Type pilus assembly protein PilM [Verrucomicrobiaceae bacterium]